VEFIYRRVSSSDQNTDRQLPDMKCDREFSDSLSGKNMERPELQAMLGMIRAGDVIHVHSLDRLGRSVIDLLGIVERTVNTGATIKFHHENLTFEPKNGNPMNDLMLVVMGAFSEFERKCIKNRQAEGIAVAKANGVYKGKRSRFTDAQFDQIKSEFKTSKNKVELATRWGITRSYLYKLAKV
jgi:DNA invertase Pin-like site-specific DNA recombinase